MAVVAPLKIVTGGDLKEMDTAEINYIKDRCRYLYGANPTVTLSVVTTGATNHIDVEGTNQYMFDDRWKTGTSATSVSSYPSEATTGEPTIISPIIFDYLNETYTSVNQPTDTSNIRFPVYYDAAGNVRSMTQTDMLDTFILPAIDTLTGSVGQPGTYRVHTSTSLAGYTSVSANAIYTDTRADQGEYDVTDNPGSPTGAAATIGTSGTTQDISEVVTNYYLLRANNISEPSISLDIDDINSGLGNGELAVCYIDSTSNIKEYTEAELDAILSDYIRYAASGRAGTRIRYSLAYDADGPGAGSSTYTGTTCGSVITNTRITTVAGDLKRRYVNANDYRSQEFPVGTATAQQYWTLKMDQY